MVGLKNCRVSVKTKREEIKDNKKGMATGKFIYAYAVFSWRTRRDALKATSK